MGFFFSEAEIIWSINSKIEMLFRVVLMKHIWEQATKETSKNINARDVEEKAFVAGLHKAPNEMQHLRQVGRFHNRLEKKLKSVLRRFINLQLSDYENRLTRVIRKRRIIEVVLKNSTLKQRFIWQDVSRREI